MCKTRFRDFVLPLFTCVVLAVLGGCGGGLGKGNSPVELYVDAVTLRESGYPNEAVDKLDEAIEKDQTFSQAYSLKGDIYQQMQAYEKSAQAYEMATKLNAWSFHDFFNLGKVYQIMKEYARAVQAYVRACELEPEHLQAHINTAECYNRLERYDDAIVYAQRAEQLDPNTVEPHRILGQAYEGKENYEQAISSYKRALEFDADNPQIMTDLAVAYLRTDRFDPAKELLVSVINIDPNNGKAYRYLGYCQLKLYEEKASQYQKLSRQNADRQQLQTLMRQGDEMVQKAIENYTQAVEIDPNDWEAHAGLGVAYAIHCKRPDGTADEFLSAKAVKHWRRSLQLNPDQPRAERLRNLIAKYRNM